MSEEIEVDDPLDCINCGAEMIHYEPEEEDERPYDECPECGYHEP